MIMTIGMINPLFIDELTVLISAVIMESFNADEQAVIGTFLETLGSMISSHSVYILYRQKRVNANRIICSLFVF